MENFLSNLLNHGKTYRKRKGCTIKDKDIQVSLIALRESCPNTEFFPARIFECSIVPNSGRMWENTDQKKAPYRDTFHAVLPKCQNKSINKPERRRKLSFRSFNSFNPSIKKELFIVLVRLKTCIFFLDLRERFGMSVILISKSLWFMNNFFVSWVAIIFPLSFTKISEKVFTKKFCKISNSTNTYWWNWNFCLKVLLQWKYRHKELTNKTWQNVQACLKN